MDNKDFSNWLVVSDVDGTLNNKLRFLPKQNLDEINRFVLDYNGHFTLASGRNPKSIRKHFEKLPIKNTPAVVLNGAGVYDFQKDKMVYFNPINEIGVQNIIKIIKKFPQVETEIITDKEAFYYNSRVVLPVMEKVNKLPFTKFKNIYDIPKENWGKVVFYGLPNTVSKLKEYALNIDNSKLNFMSSSISSFEVLNEGTHKGTALMKIAEILNIDYENTAAIGDYFNDYDMLKTVNLSACCGQAPKEIQQIVKYHACHCNKGAVGDLLRYIMENY